MKSSRITEVGKDLQDRPVQLSPAQSHLQFSLDTEMCDTARKFHGIFMELSCQCGQRQRELSANFRNQPRFAEHSCVHQGWKQRSGSAVNIKLQINTNSPCWEFLTSVIPRIPQFCWDFTSFPIPKGDFEKGMASGNQLENTRAPIPGRQQLPRQAIPGTKLALASGVNESEKDCAFQGGQ